MVEQVKRLHDEIQLPVLYFRSSSLHVPYLNVELKQGVPTRIRTTTSCRSARHGRTSELTSQMPTSGQFRASLAENHRSIQGPPSDNFRIARHSVANGRV